MAFSTMSGHQKYCVMPFGLSCTPSMFQCVINNVLRDMMGKFMVAYRNAILIYSPSQETFVNHLKKVLLQLLKKHSYIVGEKCGFHVMQISLLGYIISMEGVFMDQSNVAAVKEWSVPSTANELQRFLGFTNFYWHTRIWMGIHGFSSITSLLTALLKKELKK